ncbi:epidermal growth factor receptor-like isoform X2 [Gigantopelta aegis]|uniref:epidermal growth factor receptor-like isoform X2 n=1 Tax=Gigantopelta aegis TaxID=1735272 RepID=UPI001B8887BC|nr:epidermal growth factor receptor-like isoform X2 [Gigantopelta aegis]
MTVNMKRTLVTVVLVAFMFTFQPVTVEGKTTEPTEKDKVCKGTHNGLNLIGSPAYHYKRIQRIFTGCTYIEGNLELTHLIDPNVEYDLSFLSNIRYVTGYVIVVIVTQVDAVPLDSLQTIRGDELFPMTGSGYSLLVALNYDAQDKKRGLRELRLSSLTDISGGDVMFLGNPLLCYVNRNRWEDITGDKTKLNFKNSHLGDPPLSDRCIPCSPYCQIDQTRRCVGQNQECEKVVDYIQLKNTFKSVDAAKSSSAGIHSASTFMVVFYTINAILAATLQFHFDIFLISYERSLRMTCFKNLLCGQMRLISSSNVPGNRLL